jgi:hypothetical protein
MPTKLQLAKRCQHTQDDYPRQRRAQSAGNTLLVVSLPTPKTNTVNSFYCKSRQDNILQVFLDYGVDIQIGDGADRTSMHDSYYGAKHSFKTFEILLKADTYLIHMMYGGGALP